MTRASNELTDRTTRGLELDLSLAGVRRGQWGAHLTNELRSAIVGGRLAPQSSLPSSRRLAADLGVSRGTVVETYSQLTAEGHLITSNGGTRVARRAADVIARPSIPRRRVRRVPNPGRPDPALFPRREWLRAELQALRQLSDSDLSYGDPQGLAALRRTLAEYLGRVRSIRVHPDAVVIVNGFAQGLALVTRQLRSGGREPFVAVEDPGATGTVDQLSAWGARIVPVPVDARGLDIEALDRTDVTAVVVTPAHQYPTGVTLAPERRVALIEWARRRQALVIEDNYDAEYRYDRAPLTSLHALDPERVIAAGSTSKCLSPALRLGWLAVPVGLVEPLAEAKAMMDLGAPTIAQATLSGFIERGDLDRHIRRTRAVYRQRRNALLEALTDGVAGNRPFDIEGIAAGLHVVIQFEGSMDESRLAADARRVGLEAEALGLYRHAPGPPGLVLGYGSRTPDQLRHAVRELQIPR